MPPPKPIDEDRVKKLKAEGFSLDDISKRFGVSTTVIRRVLGRVRPQAKPREAA